MPFKPRHVEDHLYFVTATISGWVKLFERSTYRNIVIDALKWHCENKRWILFAFVIMPNHLHLIMQPREPYTISDTLQSFCSFTSHAILKQLRVNGSDKLLDYFKSRQKAPSKQHKIWRDSEAKNVYSPDFLIQKLEYIHNNPVAKGWQLAEVRSEYLWSSACFYDFGQEPVVPVSDLRSLL